jgi:hypothetical protein
MRTAVIIGALLVAGCSAPAGDTSSSDGAFVAYAADFAGFRTWEQTPGVAPGAPQPPEANDAGVHAGTLTTYMNKRPAHGSTAFPVGTMIVKEPSSGALDQRRIFAMVKRGGGYDTAGATDWEWLELRNVDDAHVAIVWRGIGPPSGEQYGGSPNACNDCHGLAKKNDFVWTQGLSLSSM